MLNHLTRPSRLTLHTIKTDIFTLLHLVEVLIEILRIFLSVSCLPGWLCDALVCEALHGLCARQNPKPIAVITWAQQPERCAPTGQLLLLLGPQYHRNKVLRLRVVKLNLVAASGHPFNLYINTTVCLPEDLFLGLV